MNAPFVLVVDDDPRVGIALCEALGSQGMRVQVAQDLRRARAAVEREKPMVVLLDLQLPDGSGMDMLPELKEKYPSTAVILISGFGSIEIAVQAMKAGADDFIVKPVLDQALFAVRNALERRRLSMDVERLKKTVERSPDKLVFKCPAMNDVVKKAVRLASFDISILISAESGTGKELLARLVHEKSGRRGLFMPIDCSAVPESLVENELFGYEKGAYTGAERRHLGRLERAQGGTVFLDEVGNMPLATQMKLLRVLQERNLERLGGSEVVELDLRILSATNVDLEDAVRKGSFRCDLYYRLNEVSLTLPPVRERREDIPLLTAHILAKYANVLGRTIPRLSRPARRALEAYDWPGNVREMKSVLKSAMLLCESGLIRPRHLPVAVSTAAAARWQPDCMVK